MKTKTPKKYPIVSFRYPCKGFEPGREVVGAAGPVDLVDAGVVDLEVLVGAGAGVSEDSAGDVDGAGGPALALLVDLAQGGGLDAPGRPGLVPLGVAHPRVKPTKVGADRGYCGTRLALEVHQGTLTTVLGTTGTAVNSA